LQTRSQNEQWRDNTYLDEPEWNEVKATKELLEWRTRGVECRLIKRETKETEIFKEVSI